MLRATLKGMASRKARLVLTSLAVILGTMFVAAAMVLTSTMEKSVSGVIADAYQGVDAVVTSAEDPAEGSGSNPSPSTVSAGVIDQIEGVSGVDQVDGEISGQVNAIGDNGKLVGTFAPTIGLNWSDNSVDQGYLELREGRGPEADGEIAVSAKFVADSGFDIGDTVTAYSYTADRTDFEIVGVYGLSGDRDSLAGETQIAFTTPDAQRLLAQGEDVFTSVYVYGDASTDDIAAALGSDEFRVQTGEEASAEAAEGFAVVADFMGYIFLGFGLVAVFVSVFLIINTFTIIVAQRQRELALLRAIGAGRGQVVRSVLTEASVIGVIASILGLGLGLLLGWGLSQVVSATMMGGLPVQLLIPATTLWALAVGIGVTVLSALVPAVKASSVPPVAAMREAVNPPKPLRGITIAGAIVFGAGAVLLAFGLRRRHDAHADPVAPARGTARRGHVMELLGTARQAQRRTQPAAHRHHRLGAHDRRRAHHRDRHPRVQHQIDHFRSAGAEPELGPDRQRRAGRGEHPLLLAADARGDPGPARGRLGRRRLHGLLRHPGRRRGRPAGVQPGPGRGPRGLRRHRRRRLGR
jgi:putative ABC transport system permease protein